MCKVLQQFIITPSPPQGAETQGGEGARGEGEGEEERCLGAEVPAQICDRGDRDGGGGQG